MITMKDESTQPEIAEDLRIWHAYLIEKPKGIFTCERHEISALIERVSNAEDRDRELQAESAELRATVERLRAPYIYSEMRDLELKNKRPRHGEIFDAIIESQKEGKA